MKLVKSLTLVAACCAPIMAHANETITYTYDARGQVIKVERSGTVNNGITTEYVIDKADNRSSVKVTGAPS
ncbi:hypothetical protein MOK15_09905 [Sphingobium sp. BYY-5]|uniref:hypothetical protein n=1 Tax=Sphingobium sp. BYY-5 TaxID=2926400 RepID=UPI001FA6FAEE|nr:hypothetical protein [Sphingobium sp. BYY-5]MCI4590407.1 hypothetical protein [Sphingobium sp. BYY-5]